MHGCYHICFPKGWCDGKHAQVSVVSRWVEVHDDLDYAGKVIGQVPAPVNRAILKTYRTDYR